MNRSNDDPGGEQPFQSSRGNRVQIYLIGRSEASDLPTPELEALGRYVLDCESLDDTTVSVAIADDSYVHELNLRYRGRDEPTDVLSFVSDSGDDQMPVNQSDCPGRYAGDILISPDAVARNAERFGISKEEELRRVMVHGMLHICGRTHETNNGDEPMLRLQEEILQRWSGEFQL